MLAAWAALGAGEFHQVLEEVVADLELFMRCINQIFLLLDLEVSFSWFLSFGLLLSYLLEEELMETVLRKDCLSIFIKAHEYFSERRVLFFGI